MRILYITSSWPHGKAFGGQLRALQIGRALKQVGDVSLTVVSGDSPDEDTVQKTAAEFSLLPPVQVVPAPNTTLVGKLRRAFDTRFLNVHGCTADPVGRQALLAALPTFDLVWILNSRTPNILNHWKWPRSVLDIDDVPSTYQRSVWQNGATLGTKLKAGMEMALLKRRENRLKERFTMLTVCSEADRKYLGDGDQIRVIPNGFQRPANEIARKPAQPVRIGFIGLFSYAPNLEGVRWFVRECWPAIKRAIPDARLRLVGKDTDGGLKPDAPDVDGLGWVADPAEEMATWSCTIIPVRHGAGTRVKIADAFSRKCPVVSTSLGAFGYEVEHERELVLADSPLEFTNACISLAEDSQKADAMADRAYDAFLKNWTWEAIAPRIHAAASSIIRH